MKIKHLICIALLLNPQPIVHVEKLRVEVHVQV